MAVAKVLVMRMAMDRRRTATDPRMRLSIGYAEAMPVLVLGVVHMPMLVLQPLVGVAMIMSFHEVKRHTGNHGPKLSATARVMGSLNMAIAIRAPMNGAIQTSAPVLAAPR